MAVVFSCESCLGKACGSVWGVWGRANGKLEMAWTPLKTDGRGVELRELPWLCLRKRLRGLRAGKRQAWNGLNALKNRWPWRLAARVALVRPAEVFEGFEGGQTAGLNTLKNRWPWRLAARVALARPAEAFEGFEGGQTAGLNGAFGAFEAWQTASLNP